MKNKNTKEVNHFNKAYGEKERIKNNGYKYWWNRTFWNNTLFYIFGPILAIKKIEETRTRTIGKAGQWEIPRVQKQHSITIVLIKQTSKNHWLISSKFEEMGHSFYDVESS